VVTTHGEREVHTELRAVLDDLRLGHLNQRGVNAKTPRVLDGGFRRQVGEAFEGVEELRPAVGIAGVVVDVGPDEDVECADALRESEREAQQDRITRRHISYRDSGANLTL